MDRNRIESSISEKTDRYLNIYFFIDSKFE